jgi:hypothetical protein
VRGSAEAFSDIAEPNADEYGSIKYGGLPVKVGFFTPRTYFALLKWMSGLRTVGDFRSESRRRYVLRLRVSTIGTSHCSNSSDGVHVA